MRFLLPRADIGRELLADELRDAGAESPRSSPTGRCSRRAEREGEPDIYRMLLERPDRRGHVHQRQPVRNFRQDFRRGPGGRPAAATVVASIGPVTAEAAQQLGIRTTIMPARYTIADLVDALVEHFARRRPDSTVTGMP